MGPCPPAFDSGRPGAYKQPAMDPAPQIAREDLVADLKDLLRRIEKIEVDVDSLTERTKIDSVGFDSLSILEFMYEVENHFGVEMEVSELVEMEVLGDLVDHVARKLAK